MGISEIVVYSDLQNNLQEFKNKIIIAQHTENQILSKKLSDQSRWKMRCKQREQRWAIYKINVILYYN